MSQTKSKILPIFKELSAEFCSVSASNLLIENSIRIAKHYLYAKRTNLYKFILNDDVQIIDLAIDAVAPLFCKNPDDELLPILKEFQSWQPPIQTEDDALFFLNKVVAGRVDQQISNLLKEHDPFFAKVLDSVTYLLRKGGYKKIKYFGRKYIVHSSCDEITGKTIDAESIERLPASLFQNRKNMLADIFSYMEKETEYFPAIPVNCLVNRLRQLSSSKYTLATAKNDLMDEIDVNEVIAYGLNAALDKLRVSYIEKGKLSGEELEWLKRVLDDLANDLKDGGINRGLYEYFAIHGKEISSEVYQAKYHNILEYLVKVMKNTIREKLIEDKE